MTKHSGECDDTSPSTTLAEFGEETMKKLERRARDKDGKVMKVPADMTYQEWKKTLDKSGGSGIMDIGRSDILQQAKTRDTKIAITNVAISKTNPPTIPHFSQQQNQKFKELHRELLTMSMNENDSNEVAFLFNSTTLKHEYEMGGTRSVNIFKNPFALDMLRESSDRELYLLHNHPTTKIFSYSDIGVFLLYDNIGGITVVSNAGKVNVIYKTETFDYEKAYSSLKQIRGEYKNEVLNEEEDAEVVKRFLKVCENCGIKFM